MKINAVETIAYVLVVIGGLNWLLIGAFSFNLVDKIFGVGSLLSRVIYTLVGISALYMIMLLVKMVSKPKTV